MRIESERALKSEETILSHSHTELANSEYVVFVDSSRRYVDCSAGVCELLGYNRDEMLTKRIEDISYDLHAVSKLFADFVQSGMQQGEFILRNKSGRPVPIKYRAFVFSDGCKAAMWDPIADWREPYLAALVETNPAQLRLKLHTALAAIRQAQSTASTTPADQRAMIDALSIIDTLSRELE